jgi:hypothetical protein
MWLLTFRENVVGDETAREAAGQIDLCSTASGVALWRGAKGHERIVQGSTTLPRALGEAKTSKVRRKPRPERERRTGEVASLVEHIL